MPGRQPPGCAPQLARGLDVVGQDEELLGEQVLLRLEEMTDALDDDARLARPRARDDNGRTLAVLDDGALSIRQRELLAFRGSRQRYGDGVASNCRARTSSTIQPRMPRSGSWVSVLSRTIG